MRRHLAIAGLLLMVVGGLALRFGATLYRELNFEKRPLSEALSTATIVLAIFVSPLIMGFAGAWIRARRGRDSFKDESANTANSSERVAPKSDDDG